MNGANGPNPQVFINGLQSEKFLKLYCFSAIAILELSKLFFKLLTCPARFIVHKFYLIGLVNGFVRVAEEPNPPLKTINLILGNYVTGFTVSLESKYPVDPTETWKLDSDFLEDFTTCAVNHGQANKRVD